MNFNTILHLVANGTIKLEAAKDDTNFQAYYVAPEFGISIEAEFAFFDYNDKEHLLVVDNNEMTVWSQEDMEDNVVAIFKSTH